MDAWTSFMLLIAFIGGILLFLSSQARTGLSTIGMKMRRALPAPWGLSEFLKRKQSQWSQAKYYSFSEETVRSLGHRFIGRFDSAILHLDSVPVLDLVIEHKFPVKYLPEKSRPEDMFQAGLYAQALQESGVSCSKTRLVNIYCLQDRAKRCMEGRSVKSCWKCGDSRIYVIRFDSQKVVKALKRLDEVWYNGRKPRPSPKPGKCIACPYGKDKCNYSVA